MALVGLILGYVLLIPIAFFAGCSIVVSTMH